ncbi:MAG: c-type cytochrome, partial [Flavipsychrobacter sp.]
TIKKPGLYDGACSEFCGQEHAWMRIHVYAELPAVYTAWLTAHAHNAMSPSGTEALLGASIFQQKSCGNCHRIGGTAALGTTGPDLTHFASRHTILTGILSNTADNIDKWLADPQKVKPGAYMPNFNFDKSSRQALVTYLTQLK